MYMQIVGDTSGEPTRPPEPMGVNPCGEERSDEGGSPDGTNVGHRVT